MSGSTQNYKLTLPDYGSSNWAEVINSNFNFLDSIIKSLESQLNSTAINTNISDTGSALRVELQCKLTKNSNSATTSFSSGSLTLANGVDCYTNVHFTTQEINGTTTTLSPVNIDYAGTVTPPPPGSTNYTFSISVDSNAFVGNEIIYCFATLMFIPRNTSD